MGGGVRVGRPNTHIMQNSGKASSQLSDPDKLSTMEFFLLIRICMGYRTKFSLVAQAATLGNFFNLHKCKMAADRYRSFLILEPLVPTSQM